MTPSRKWMPVVRRSLVALAVLATLLALFVVVENWRGDRAWRETERDLRARGVALDFTGQATPPVPDALNFFKEPLLESVLYRESPNPGAVQLLAALERLAPYVSNSSSDSLNDLPAFRTQFQKAKLIGDSPSPDPALDLLNALQPVAPLLDAVRRAGLERPRAWMPFRLITEQPEIRLGAIFALGRLIAFRAKLEIALGRTDDAFADLMAT
ncbi:MAG: hypothetical protein ABIZ49_01860, partial [Opitutaceae bacterium]